MVSVCHGFVSGMSGQCWLGVSHEIVIRCWPGLLSAKVPTGARGPITKVAHLSKL